MKPPSARRPDSEPTTPEQRAWDWRRLSDNVVLASVVGSRAWGLAHDASDEDVRGCFVLPFEEHASLDGGPEVLEDKSTGPAGIPRDAVYWEIEKLLRQALRGEANTLECLWSPHHVVITPLGQKLVDARGAFSSMRVVGSFGRYAESQLKKLTSRAPDDVRPKNAYNLVRLLHSCISWLTRGEPLILVEGAVRDELLAIKEGRAPVDVTLARAQELIGHVDELARTSTLLPAEPDVRVADELLREARRHAARVAFATNTDVVREGARIPGPPAREDLFTLRFFPAPLPSDVETGGLRRFLERKLTTRLPQAGVLVIGLTGAHAYGFPSPDSDLDLKAIHALPASRFLGLQGPPDPLEIIEIWEGREMDLSSHELGQAAQLLLKGNGNMLERLLGPMPVVVTPLGERLAHLAERMLSSRVVHHYRGFLRAMERESALEARTPGPDGGRTAKRLLYAYRVAFTGAHLLLEKKLVTDVRALAPVYGFALPVEELVVRKSSGEFSKLTEDEAAKYLEDLPRLHALIDDAYACTALPEEPQHVDELEALMVEARLALI
jgi:hypothetical protein